ncbi:MAG TPA: MYXO-CTERM sorting domain-containing protein, partial [Nannocystaceae bacterium]|nr:MYXO-CTERM sorting domain-containing protein [Nannocystaceae bacterium]
VESGELIDGICSGTYDSTAWDGNAFATQMTLRIVEPGAHAADLLGQNDYLTRMYTTISPGEMTTDPMFWESPDLPDVSNQLTTNQRWLCNGDNVWTLPDGREVYLPAGADWPDFPDEPEGTPGQMPSSEIIEAVMPAGAPMRLTENTASIDAVIMAHNEKYGWQGGAMPDTGGNDSGDTGDGEAGQDGDGDGGGDSSGCACASDRSSGGGWGAMVVLMSLGALRRRRRG